MGTAERIACHEQIPEIAIFGPHVDHFLGFRMSAIRFRESLIESTKRGIKRIVVSELQEGLVAPFVKILEGGFSGSLSSVRADSADRHSRHWLKCLPMKQEILVLVP